MLENTSWVLMLSDSTEWCRGTVDAAGDLVPHPFTVTRDGDFFPLSELAMAAITNLAPTGGSSGTNYLVDDILTLTGGVFITAATARVASIGGGGEVTSVDTVTSGVGYTQYPNDAAGTTTDSASGAGCTLDQTFEGVASGKLVPLTPRDGASITANGIELECNATFPESIVRFPITMKRPIAVEFKLAVSEISAGPIFYHKVVRSLDETDDYGGWIGNSSGWKVSGAKTTNGTPANASTKPDITTIVGGDMRLFLDHGYQTAGVPFFVATANAWGARTMFNSGLTVDNGQDWRNEPERFFIDLRANRSLGNATLTVKGIKITDSIGQGIT
jgi:hypothetical protein